MEIIQILGLLLAAVFAILSFFHFYWAAGGKFAGGAAIPTEKGERVFSPSVFATIMVAVLLMLAMFTVLGRIKFWGDALPSWIFYFGTLSISLLFFLRAVGDFRYVGLFKRVSESDFARWDNYLFTPLCLIIAVAALLISIFDVNE